MARKTWNITKRDAAAALHTSFPIMATFIALGVGYGILMEKHGFGPLWSSLSGIVIFSGTVQFVSVSLFAGGSPVMAAVTAFIVAARHIFFSISMIDRYRSEGRQKWYLYYALCDETYAMLSRDSVPPGVNRSAYRLLVTLFNQTSWVAGSFLGGWLGALLNFNSTGIDFAMTALFTTVFIQQWIDSRSHIPAVLGLTATLVCRILFGRDLFLIPAMIIIIGTLTVMRGQIESDGGFGND
ncbi:MAG: AzlC family ABC transporter permease [Oscillibacter sp.]|nr:AzlC family ABC transporter permease [Oscillibacter sp.]